MAVSEAEEVDNIEMGSRTMSYGAGGDGKAGGADGSDLGGGEDGAVWACGVGAVVEDGDLGGITVIES